MGTTQSSSEESTPNVQVSRSNSIKFFLHDVEHVVEKDNIGPRTSLNYYIRNIMKLNGTKAMCYEGGCGSCVVVLQNKDPITEKDTFLAVNSCLVPLLSCNGWRIYTIEGISDTIQGYHPIQTALADFNGSQCGFCSPGMVMNMYALYKSESLSKEQIEKSFSGNICRCTGYRSILDAFKSFSKSDESPDIEDLPPCYQKECLGSDSCKVACDSITKPNLYLEFSDSKWIKVHTLNDLLSTLKLNNNSTYKLVAGNTAEGVYKSYRKEVDLYVDISDVLQLKVRQVQQNISTIGASTTLTNTIEFFKLTSNFPQFSYLKLLTDHIELVANVPVRNRGTLAGNLMIKHDHHEFPSDIFLLLETVGAKLIVVNLNNEETQLTPLNFIDYDMNNKVLVKITLPALPNKSKFVSFKIMPRAQNAHALVNAGFLFTFGPNNFVQSATIVYGNINPTFVHAKNTERFLVGVNLFDNSILQQVYKKLDAEINAQDMPPESSPKFRKQLAIALFYKAVLRIAPDAKVSPRNKSGGSILVRPISRGSQDYDTDSKVYPLTKALPKLEARAQTSGEAEYVDDIPDLSHQLFAALVLAQAPPNSVITNIDTSKALKRPGVVAFYSKSDIPGENFFTANIPPIVTNDEILFCEGTVRYYDQPLGVLVGNSQEVVEEATKFVEVTYTPPATKPLLTTRDILKASRHDKIEQYSTIQPKKRGTDIKYTIKGTFDIYHQYHFHMETQTVLVVPTEHELVVFSATQATDLVQYGISRVLNIPMGDINVRVRRCGGGFGGKLSRCIMVACAAALAASKLKKPIKLRLPLSINMRTIGKRFPCSADYEVGVNAKGVIQYLDCTIYSDAGFMANAGLGAYIESILKNTYNSDTFKFILNFSYTDTHTNTWTRAPGSAEAAALMETIMEHIAYTLNIDPVSVRLANLRQTSPLINYINDMKTWSNYDQLKSDITNFNKQNRWKKRGVALIPMSFDVLLIGTHFATVSIFHKEGSVQISHGGVEIGQGINTKAAQVCAYKFQIPLDMITILPTNSFISPNNVGTGGTIASDGVCWAVEQACDELLGRIQPYRTAGALWKDVIKKCFENNVMLKATGRYAPKQQGLQDYAVYGACAVVVEVDILTGQSIINSTYINQDTGRSPNPVIDVGQVEGGFVMGMGYYTLEEIKFSPEGKVLTDNTWTYYPPGALDIPVNFFVRFPKNNPYPNGVVKSKGTGEPAFTLGFAVVLAKKLAVSSARTDASASNSKWYNIDGPSSVPNVFMNSINSYDQYVL